MKCGAARKHVDAYVDGELEPSRSLDVEHHVQECPECRQHVGVQRSLKLQVATSLRSVQAPDELRARVLGGIDEVAERGARTGLSPTVLLTATAAAVLLAASWVQRPASSQQQAGVSSTAGAMPVFRDIVQRHAHPLPAEFQSDRPDQILPWFRGKVAFQVQPVAFKAARVQFLGARIDHVRDLSAATLYYDVDGRRLTTVVFEPTPDLYEGAERMKLGGRDVYFRSVHGYPVPMIRHGNLAYAFTGDLDQRNLLRLVASAQLP